MYVIGINNLKHVSLLRYEVVNIYKEFQMDAL